MTAESVDARQYSLEEAMQLRGFASDAAFARAVGVTSIMVGHWRLKQHLPRPRTYARILTVLQLPPDALDLSPSTGPGRRQGYRHSEETKQRISRGLRAARQQRNRIRELAVT